MSTAITRAAVNIFRYWIAYPPRPPAPIRIAVDDVLSFGATLRTAWYGVTPASASGPTILGSSEVSGTSSRRGTTRYSARPPS